MKVFTRRACFVVGLLLMGFQPGILKAQHGLPPRTMAFEVVGTDSASGQPVEIHLMGKSMGPKGRTYAGKCTIKAGERHPQTAKLVGEWQFTQNSSTNVAGGARPAIGGIGTRVGAKPWKPGQNPTGPGQFINFTIDPLPDGRYSVLLMDTFNDDMLEFKYAPAAK